MQEKKQENELENSLQAWYQELPRREKSQFLLALQLKFGMSQTGLYAKIKKDNWLPYQREIVESIIEEGSWRR